MKKITLTTAWILLCSLILVSYAVEHSSPHHNGWSHHRAITPRQKHQNFAVPIGIQMPEQVLSTREVSCISADKNIFEIMNKAKESCRGQDMRCTFYYYANHEYQILGTLDIDKKLFDDLLMKYDNWLLTAGKIGLNNTVPSLHENRVDNPQESIIVKDYKDYKARIDKSDDSNEAKGFKTNHGLYIDKYNHNLYDYDTNESQDKINPQRTANPHENHSKNHNKENSGKLIDANEREWKNGNYIKLKPKYDNDHGYYEVILPKDNFEGLPRIIYVDINKENNEIVLFDEAINKELNSNKPVRIELEEFATVADSLNKQRDKVAKSPNHMQNIQNNNLNFDQKVTRDIVNINSEINTDETNLYVKDTTQYNLDPSVFNSNDYQNFISDDSIRNVNNIVNGDNNLVVPNKYINQAQFYVESESNNVDFKKLTDKIPMINIKLPESNDIVSNTKNTEEASLNTIGHNENNVNTKLDLNVKSFSPKNIENYALKQNYYNRSTENYGLSKDSVSTVDYDSNIIELVENTSHDFDDIHDTSYTRSSNILHLNEPIFQIKEPSRENKSTSYIFALPKITSYPTTGVSDYTGLHLDPCSFQNQSVSRVPSSMCNIPLSSYHTAPQLGNANALETESKSQPTSSSFTAHTFYKPSSAPKNTSPNICESTSPILPGLKSSSFNVGFNWLPSYARSQDMRLPYAVTHSSQSNGSTLQRLTIPSPVPIDNLEFRPPDHAISVEDPSSFQSVASFGVGVNAPYFTTNPLTTTSMSPGDISLASKSNTDFNGMLLSVPLAETPLRPKALSSPYPVQQTQPWMDSGFIKSSPIEFSSKPLPINYLSADRFKHPYITLPQYVNPYLESLPVNPLSPISKTAALDSSFSTLHETNPLPGGDCFQKTKSIPLQPHLSNTPLSPKSHMLKPSILPNTFTYPYINNVPDVKIPPLTHTVFTDKKICDDDADNLTPGIELQPNMIFDLNPCSGIVQSPSDLKTLSSHEPDFSPPLTLDDSLISLPPQYENLSTIQNILEKESLNELSETVSLHTKVPITSSLLFSPRNGPPKPVLDSSLTGPHLPSLSPINPLFNDENQIMNDKIVLESDPSNLMPLDTSLIGPDLELKKPSLILDATNSQTKTLSLHPEVPFTSSKQVEPQLSLQNQPPNPYLDSSIIGPYLSTLSPINPLLNDESMKEKIFLGSNSSNLMLLDSSLTSPDLELENPPLMLDSGNSQSPTVLSYPKLPFSEQIEPQFNQNQPSNSVLDSSLIGPHLPILSPNYPLVSDENRSIIEDSSSKPELTDLIPSDSTLIGPQLEIVNPPLILDSNSQSATLVLQPKVGFTSPSQVELQLNQNQPFNSVLDSTLIGPHFPVPSQKNTILNDETENNNEVLPLKHDHNTLIPTDSAFIYPELELENSPRMPDSNNSQSATLLSHLKAILASSTKVKPQLSHQNKPTNPVLDSSLLGPHLTTQSSINTLISEEIKSINDELSLEYDRNNIIPTDSSLIGPHLPISTINLLVGDENRNINEDIIKLDRTNTMPSESSLIDTQEDFVSQLEQLDITQEDEKPAQSLSVIITPELNKPIEYLPSKLIGKGLPLQSDLNMTPLDSSLIGPQIIGSFPFTTDTVENKATPAVSQDILQIKGDNVAGLESNILSSLDTPVDTNLNLTSIPQEPQLLGEFSEPLDNNFSQHIYPKSPQPMKSIPELFEPQFDEQVELTTDSLIHSDVVSLIPKHKESDFVVIPKPITELPLLDRKIVPLLSKASTPLQHKIEPPQLTPILDSVNQPKSSLIGSSLQQEEPLELSLVSHSGNQLESSLIGPSLLQEMQPPNISSVKEFVNQVNSSLISPSLHQAIEPLEMSPLLDSVSQLDSSLIGPDFATLSATNSFLSDENRSINENFPLESDLTDLPLELSLVDTQADFENQIERLLISHYKNPGLSLSSPSNSAVICEPTEPLASDLLGEGLPVDSTSSIHSSLPRNAIAAKIPAVSDDIPKSPSLQVLPASLLPPTLPSPSLPCQSITDDNLIPLTHISEAREIPWFSSDIPYSSNSKLLPIPSVSNSPLLDKPIAPVLDLKTFLPLPTTQHIFLPSSIDNAQVPSASITELNMLPSDLIPFPADTSQILNLKLPQSSEPRLYQPLPSDLQPSGLSTYLPQDSISLAISKSHADLLESLPLSTLSSHMGKPILTESKSKPLSSSNFLNKLQSLCLYMPSYYIPKTQSVEALPSLTFESSILNSQPSVLALPPAKTLPQYHLPLYANRIPYSAVYSQLPATPELLDNSSKLPLSTGTSKPQLYPPSESKPIDELLSSTIEVSPDYINPLSTGTDLQTLILNTLLNTPVSLQDDIASEVSPLTFPDKEYLPMESIVNRYPCLKLNSFPFYANQIPLDVSSQNSQNNDLPSQGLPLSSLSLQPLESNILTSDRNKLCLSKNYSKNLSIYTNPHIAFNGQQNTPFVVKGPISPQYNLRPYSNVPLDAKFSEIIKPAPRPNCPVEFPQTSLPTDTYPSTVIGDSEITQLPKHILEDGIEPSAILTHPPINVGFTRYTPQIMMKQSSFIPEYEKTPPCLNLVLDNSLKKSPITTQSPQIQPFLNLNHIASRQLHEIPKSLKSETIPELDAEFALEPCLESPIFTPSLSLDTSLQLPIASNESYNMSPRQFSPAYFTLPPIYTSSLPSTVTPPIVPTLSHSPSVSYTKPMSTLNTIPSSPSPLSSVSPLEPLKTAPLSNNPNPLTGYTEAYANPFLAVLSSPVSIDTSPAYFNKPTQAMTSPKSSAYSHLAPVELTNLVSPAYSGSFTPVSTNPIVPTQTDILSPSYSSFVIPRHSYPALPGSTNTLTQPFTSQLKSAEVAPINNVHILSSPMTPSPLLSLKPQKYNNNPFAIAIQRLPISPIQNYPTHIPKSLPSPAYNSPTHINKLQKNIPCGDIIESNLQTPNLEAFTNELTSYKNQEESIYTYSNDKGDTFYEQPCLGYPLKSFSYTLAPEEVTELLLDRNLLPQEGLKPNLPATSLVTDPALKFNQILHPTSHTPLLAPCSVLQALPIPPSSLTETNPQYFPEKNALLTLSNTPPIQLPIQIPPSVLSSPLLKSLSPTSRELIDSGISSGQRPYNILPMHEKPLFLPLMPSIPSLVISNIPITPHVQYPPGEASSFIDSSRLGNTIPSQATPQLLQVPNVAPYIAVPSYTKPISDTISTPTCSTKSHPTILHKIPVNYFSLPPTYTDIKSKKPSLQGTLIRPSTAPNYNRYITPNVRPVEYTLCPQSLTAIKPPVSPQYITTSSPAQSLKKMKPISSQYISSILPTPTTLQDNFLAPIDAPIELKPYVPSELSSSSENSFKSPPMTLPCAVSPSFINVVEPVITISNSPSLSPLTPQYSSPKPTTSKTLPLSTPSSTYGQYTTPSSSPYTSSPLVILPNRLINKPCLPEVSLPSTPVYETPSHSVPSADLKPSYTVPNHFPLPKKPSDNIIFDIPGETYSTQITTPAPLCSSSLLKPSNILPQKSLPQDIPCNSQYVAQLPIDNVPQLLPSRSPLVKSLLTSSSNNVTLLPMHQSKLNPTFSDLTLSKYLPLISNDYGYISPSASLVPYPETLPPINPLSATPNSLLKLPFYNRSPVPNQLSHLSSPVSTTPLLSSIESSPFTSTDTTLSPSQILQPIPNEMPLSSTANIVKAPWLNTEKLLTPIHPRYDTADVIPLYSKYTLGPSSSFPLNANIVKAAKPIAVSVIPTSDYRSPLSLDLPNTDIMIERIDLYKPDLKNGLSQLPLDHGQQRQFSPAVTPNFVPLPKPIYTSQYPSSMVPCLNSPLIQSDKTPLVCIDDIPKSPISEPLIPDYVNPISAITKQRLLTESPSRVSSQQSIIQPKYSQLPTTLNLGFPQNSAVNQKLPSHLQIPHYSKIIAQPSPIYKTPQEYTDFNRGSSSPQVVLRPLTGQPTPVSSNPEPVCTVPHLVKPQNWLQSPIFAKSLPHNENPVEIITEKGNIPTLINRYKPANMLTHPQVSYSPYELQTSIPKVSSELDYLKPIESTIPLLMPNINYVEDIDFNKDSKTTPCPESENVSSDEVYPKIAHVSFPNKIPQKPQSLSKLETFYDNNHIGKNSQVCSINPTYNAPINSQTDIKIPCSTIAPGICSYFNGIPTKNFGSIPKFDTTSFRPNMCYPEIPQTLSEIPTIIQSYPMKPDFKYNPQSKLPPNKIELLQTPEIAYHPTSNIPYNNIGDIKYSGYKTYQIPSLKSSQVHHNLEVPSQNYNPSTVTYSSPSVHQIPYSSHSPTTIPEPLIPHYEKPLNMKTPLQTKLSLKTLQQSPQSNEYNPTEDINENNELKTSLVNYLINKGVKGCLFNNNDELTIPLGNLAITRKEPCNADTIATNNPSIGLKVWKSNIKVVQAELKLKCKELSVNNFMPILNNIDKYDVNEIRKTVKNYIDEKYGNHIEVNEPYTTDNQYTVIRDLNHNAVDNKFNLLWPTNYV